MQCIALLVLASVFIVSTSVSDYYFVVAPNVIRFEHAETVTVTIFGPRKNVFVSVWLEHRDKKFSTTNVTVANEATPNHTTVQVTDADLFDSVLDEKPRQIKLCAQRDSDSRCRDVVLSYKTGFLVLQTDKPVYTPLQNVNIRVLALNESLKRIDERRHISLDIITPNGRTVGRRTFPAKEISGFYKHTFSLPPSPDLGIWTARAFISGQFETESRAKFVVEEYVLPTFGVTIHVSTPYILQNYESDFTITVIAKYVYGKKVEGYVRLSLNMTNENGDSQFLLDYNRNPFQAGVKEFAVKVGDIFNSTTLRDRAFPDGWRLRVVAMVTEEATGTVEITQNDNTLFTSQPFIFKFTRSKIYFRPGMSFYFKVDVLHANGDPARNEPVTLKKMDSSGNVLDTDDRVTDNYGRALAIFSTEVATGIATTLGFQVESKNYQQVSEVLQVTNYNDRNQIQVERIVMNDDTMVLRAFTNIQLDSSGNAQFSYSGMMFMVISRGKVVYTAFKPAGNIASEEISNQLQELISPSARLLVFYVDYTEQRIVADSVKFYVTPKCRGAGLTLSAKSQLLPGANSRVSVTGAPHMWVGLNVMDKALLLLNDENILKKDKMFAAFETHDLGCGEGSGKNNGDVFKNAGLTVLTNALVSNDISRTQNDDCFANKRRRKRDVSDCFGVDQQCCNYGILYAEKVFYDTEKEDRAKLDPYTKCYVQARKMTLENHLRTICIHAYFKSCLAELESFISDITLIVSKSLDDISDYAQDLEIIASIAGDNYRPHIRTDFRESFLFEEYTLDAHGNKSIALTYPDSITDWMIQAIGISENEGVCIAEPVDVTVFRDFFIQLHMPYKATRLELLEIKATIFNYGEPEDDPKQANIYIHGINDICMSGVPGRQSSKIPLELEPNTAQTVSFPMVPVKAGSFPIRVEALVINLGMPYTDIIEKPLYVVNDGIEERLTIRLCLDPNQQVNDCESTQDRTKTTYVSENTRVQISDINLTLPPGHIPGTGIATAYVQGNAIEGVIKILLSGVDSLFRIPYGCAEQTVSSFAPNVYAMKYLKKTNQVTASIEINGTSNIRAGIDRETSMYRLSDGSYFAYASGKTSSVWLTAFVAKTFCHAKTVVNDALSETDDLYPTLRWLKDRVGSDGRVTEIYNVWSETRLMGQTDDDTLAIYVLISLLECNIKAIESETSSAIQSTVGYIEQLSEDWLKQRPFALALSTYALALVKSNQRYIFKDWLHDISKHNGLDTYWSLDLDSGWYASSRTIETTSYALLAMLQFDDLVTSSSIVRFLTSKQDANGVFRSTQDTTMALQALSEYSIRTYSPKTDLKVFLLADGWQGADIRVRNERFQLERVVSGLPVERGNNTLRARIEGTSGSGTLVIDLRYNRPANSDEVCSFQLSEVSVSDVIDVELNADIANIRDCDVCGFCKKDPVRSNLNALTTEAPSEEANSNFGRRRREAGTVANQKCIRFNVSSPGNEHGMTNVIFGIETNVGVIKSDIDKLIAANPNLDQYELPTDKKGYIVFYLNTLTTTVNEFVFRLEGDFESDTAHKRQPAVMSVFDYYNPDKKCKKMYSTVPNKLAIGHTCKEERSEECRCKQSVCSNPVEDEIRKLYQSNEFPVVKLRQHTCNAEKADYAMFVEVKSIWNDTITKFARAVLKRKIHSGAVVHEAGDNITFSWTTTCSYPDLVVDKRYYVIGKDGHVVIGENGQAEVRYTLMGSALVIQFYPSPVKFPQIIRTVMKRYENSMRLNGCLA